MVWQISMSSTAMEQAAAMMSGATSAPRDRGCGAVSRAPTIAPSSFGFSSIATRPAFFLEQQWIADRTAIDAAVSADDKPGADIRVAGERQLTPWA